MDIINQYTSSIFISFISFVQSREAMIFHTVKPKRNFLKQYTDRLHHCLSSGVCIYVYVLFAVP